MARRAVSGSSQRSKTHTTRLLENRKLSGIIADEYDYRACKRGAQINLNPNGGALILAALEPLWWRSRKQATPPWMPQP
jgi:hypothetical protein